MVEHSARRNMILAALPEREYEELVRLMRREYLEAGQVLYEQDERVADVYFPLSGAVSVLIQMADGQTYGPGIIGREGMLGFPIGLGDDVSRWRSVVQIPGAAMVMPREALRDHLIAPGHLGQVLTHYAGLLISLIAQSAACAQFHTLQQGCVRWFLLMHDRADGDEFEMTHEYLSMMLGSHRPNVTDALHVLRDQDLIEMKRGRIRIRDRQRLEDAACECYRRIRIKYDEPVEVSERRSVGGGHPYTSEETPQEQ